MRNADEHKNLLEQVAALERDSVNYFDVEKEFFLITSTNLTEVRTRLYGYSIQSDGIYEDDNLTPEAVKGLDGRGCYVYVEARDGQITIKQDLNGCWGIYLFRQGNYFALSNSFFRLLDHVKFRYPLTVNRDYCHYLFVNTLCSHAYSETAVNEIQRLNRREILHIDTTTKTFEIELIDYKENSISLDSAEGIATLDSWFYFWCKFLYSLAQRTKFITADLSGGFDSRVSFLLLIHSGVDYTKMRINSFTDYSCREDFKIASKIATHYGVTLNQDLPECRYLNYSLADSWNIDLYYRQTFKKMPDCPTQKAVDKQYSISGYGGEIIRHYWNMPPKKFLNSQTGRKLRIYSPDLTKELSLSIKNVINAAFHDLRNKYQIENANSSDIPACLYREARCSNHYGRNNVGRYFKNIMILSPCIDPIIRTLKLCTDECPDDKLLMSMIFDRYEPTLLSFPIQGKRSIAPETIACAHKINERFPLAKKLIDRVGGGFNLQPRDLRIEKILAAGRNNKELPALLPRTFLKAAFDSSKTYGLFTAYFDAEFYHYAANFYDNNKSTRENYCYSVFGVAKVLEDVEISRGKCSPYLDVKRFMAEDFCKIPNMSNAAQIPERFYNSFTARVDIKLLSNNGDFKILFVSDMMAKVIKPEWLQKEGTGYVVTSCAGNLEIVAKASDGGRILVTLKGMNVRDKADSSKRVPYWIDYTALTINGQKVFDKLTPVWHDKTYRYTVDVEPDEEITIAVEWQPHRSDT